MTSLINKFEEALDNESKRIVSILMKMYHNKVVVNQKFEILINSLINSEFKYYICDIQFRIYLFLPIYLQPDPNNHFVLVSRRNGNKEHLLKYINACVYKDHKKVAKQIAQDLVNYSQNHKLAKKSLVELISWYVEKYFPSHNDSLDTRSIVLLLEKEILMLGYTVKSISPFILQENNI